MNTPQVKNNEPIPIPDNTPLIDVDGKAKIDSSCTCNSILACTCLKPCQNGCTKQCCFNKQVLISQKTHKNLLVLHNQQWKAAILTQLTRKAFGNHKIAEIQKIKWRRKLCPYSNSFKYNQHIMKIMTVYKDTYYASPPDVIQDYFEKIIFAKLNLLIPQQKIVFKRKIQGEIFIKQGFFGKWQPDYVLIDQNEGLNCSIQLRHINQIWTWFQIYQETHLIIKVNSSSKVQFAIPLSNLHKWLSAFFFLITKQEK